MIVSVILYHTTDDNVKPLVMVTYELRQAAPSAAVKKEVLSGVATSR